MRKQGLKPFEIFKLNRENLSTIEKKTIQYKLIWLVEICSRCRKLLGDVKFRVIIEKIARMGRN